jgi:hypothetical protein
MRAHRGRRTALTLGDGRSVIGFLAESNGVEGARDITGLARWRAFMANTAGQRFDAQQRRAP